MTYEDFSFECRRLDSIKIPRNDGELKERQALEQELWRKYSWMMAPQWKSTVSWVIDKHKSKTLPAMPEFSAAVGMMRDKGIIKTEACRSCNGTKMQYVRVRHAPTDREFDACKPCSVCMVGAQMELKRDLELIGEGGGNASPLRMAHAMSPQAAYWAIHRGDAMGVKWDEDIKMVLLNKAMEYDAVIEERKSKQPTPAKNVVGLMVGTLSNLKVQVPVSGEQPQGEGNPGTESVDWDEVA